MNSSISPTYSTGRIATTMAQLCWTILALVAAVLIAACLDKPYQVCPETGHTCPPGYTCSPSGATCVASLSCGDGEVGADEVCDDGNRLNGDGCSSDCLSQEDCGNGTRDIYEACDDGNQADGDGCSRDCVIEGCGNGVEGDPYEACDDGNYEYGDGCSADCASDETCGNGYIDWWQGEICDDGNTSDGDDCPTDCGVGSCGDGVLQAGEACDDGNTRDGDGCSANCQSDGICGNGSIEPGELCDGDGMDTRYCDADCTLSRCGDGYFNPVALEECDDAGISSTCDPDCTLAACGDNMRNPVAGEACDDGNTLDGDLCSADCAYSALLTDLSLTSVSVPDLDFSPEQLTYHAQVALIQDQVSIIAHAADPAVELEVMGQPVNSGQPSQAISLALGVNAIPVIARYPASGIEAHYEIVVNRAGAIIQAAYAKQSNTDGGDEFGLGLALSANGDTLAVSAWFEDSNATGVNGNQADNSAMNSGAVYVFQRAGGTWVQQAYLKASNTDLGDDLGLGVTLSANGDTLAVSGYRENSNATGVDGDQADNSATNSGAVYVFQRSGGVWAQQAYLKASNTDALDEFGNSVALSADGDCLAVGALYEDSSATGVNGDQTDNSATNSGAVYVFQRSGDTWAQQAYLKASNTGPNDLFGTGMKLSANGDTLAVGAHSEDSNATGVDGNQSDNSMEKSGAVYVFQRSGDTWVQQAYLKASNSDAFDEFGWITALSASGDTLAVGAWLEDSNTTGVNGNQADNSAGDSGAVYVFQRSGDTWAQQAYLKASNSDPGDWFGVSVALSASGDTLAVGASQEGSFATDVGGNQTNNSAVDSGAVYLFRRVGNVWAAPTYLKASNTGSGDSFGRLVALSANGDTLAVGAHRESSNATGVNGDQTNNAAGASGAAYLFQ